MKTKEELKNLFDSRLKPALLSMEEERLILKKKTITAMTGILIPVALFFVFKGSITLPIAILLFAVMAAFLFKGIKLEKWKPFSRRLSIRGITLVINLFSASKLWRRLNSVSIPDEVIYPIQNKFVEFH